MYQSLLINKNMFACYASLIVDGPVVYVCVMYDEKGERTGFGFFLFVCLIENKSEVLADFVNLRTIKHHFSKTWSKKKSKSDYLKGSF